jgi:hypothetical protein
VSEPEESEPEVSELEESVESDSELGAEPAEPVEENVDQPTADPIPDSNVVNLFPARKVDGLFAKLRAETSEADLEPTEPALTVATSVEQVESPAPQIDDSVFGQREAAVVPLIVAAARKAKRILADEQNEVLGLMRAASSITSVEDVIADSHSHTMRYVTAIGAELSGAVSAGAEVSGGEAAGGPPSADPSTATAISADDLARISSFVADGLIEPLRSRLDRAVLDVGGDIDDAIRRVRAVYREWKTQHIDQHLEDVMRLAYGLGLMAGVPAGTKMCWLMDPHGTPCPDAEDNSLAGEVAAGQPYPTGHTYAPAYPGCRCMVLPAAKIPESS